MVVRSLRVPRTHTTSPHTWTVAITLLLLELLHPAAPLEKTPISSCDRHLPPGLGFLVSDNYPFEYRDNASCTYTIPRWTHLGSARQAVCFRFHRFSTELTRDYLEISGHRYSGYGVLTSRTTAFSSVWREHFCWVINEMESKLKLTFHSNQMTRSLGFYATYKMVTVDELQPRGTTTTDADNAVGCREMGMPCFDRTCHQGAPCTESWTNGCLDKSDRSYAHARCTTVRGEAKQQAGQYACDFDVLCNTMWALGRMWKVVDQSTDPEFGPDIDHTSAGLTYNRGSYMVRDFSDSTSDVLTDIVLSVMTPPRGLHCLSLWYHMYGYDVGQLQVFRKYLGPKHGSLWTRHGSYGNYWHHGHVAIFNNGSANEDIVLSAVRGSEYRAQIAIDDISLMAGACPYYDDISCTFNENSLCGWRAEGGFVSQPEYMTQSWGNTILSHWCLSAYCPPASLLSPPLGAGRATCLILRYRFGQSQSSGHLTVWSHGAGVRQVHGTLYPDKRSDNGWHLAQFHMMPNNGVDHVYQVELESHLIRGGYMEIDEVNFIQASCSEIKVGSCHMGLFRCKHGWQCVPRGARCDGVADCQDGSDESRCHFTTGCGSTEFVCENSVCVAERLKCNGFDDCGDFTDELDCQDTQSTAGISYSPVALVALVAGILIVLLIIFIRVGLFLHTKWKQRQLIELHERHMEAIHQLRCNSIDSMPTEFQPPSYDECQRDNPAFVLGEGSEQDKRDLPSYSQVIDEGFLMITHPVGSELERLRAEMVVSEQQTGNVVVGIEGDGRVQQRIQGGIHEGIQQGIQQGDQQGIQQEIQERVQDGSQEVIQERVQQGYQQEIQQGDQQEIQQGDQLGFQQEEQQVIQQGIQQEEVQQGIEQGIQQGIEQGIQQGIEQGIQEGVQQGVQHGLLQGGQEQIQQGIQQVGMYPEVHRVVDEGIETLLVKLNSVGCAEDNMVAQHCDEAPSAQIEVFMSHGEEDHTRTTSSGVDANTNTAYCTPLMNRQSQRGVITVRDNYPVFPLRECSTSGVTFTILEESEIEV